ncbi:DUF305 domain-containing protein [Actinoplanes regularis]|uniref:Uncharacterized conserved protein, DUF305 family n=1 Tax=Actinoplanes regularis TaxID=52697 RepID=A0A238Y7D9_9ACTN|nr:DUF305 domain-containing protein [Actinoplanes regularis]GIE86121.1 hypothetical protein Are01nite_26010 [Actinoplanes regularis]SNR67017.1 Uncharacterized conserved protein, DUF305 family [Actinoplanes regularis]
MTVRRLAAALVLALAAVTVVLLRTGDRDVEKQQVASESVAAPSGTDVHYAQMMVAHHEQAVRMSRTLIAKGDVPERIRLIAEFIVHDQQREIDQTNDWLTAWNQPAGTPEGGSAHGMLTQAQLDELDRADARTAAPVFLRLMIEHHRGAITMSRSLLDGPGGNAYIHSLAKHVVNEQTAENDAMTALLKP